MTDYLTYEAVIIFFIWIFFSRDNPAFNELARTLDTLIWIFLQ